MKMETYRLSEIVDKIIFMKTKFQKALGLMFRFKFFNEAYVFVFDYDKKIPIHMIFVFTSIDAIWINSDGEIVDLKKKILPFTPAVYHKGRAKILIELPSGTISKKKMKLMDKILID
jgi:uncharacterized membrane protein (UPF0127 family)